MTITAWFPTLIYSENIINEFSSNYNIDIINKAKEYQQKYTPDAGWACDTFNTMGIDIRNNEPFKTLIDICIQHVIKFSKEYGVNSNIICHECWINIAPPGEYQEYHIHNNNHFSLVYYVKAPPNSGNICFSSHESASDMFPLPDGAPAPPNFKTCDYKPIESHILIFRSNLLHMVHKNKSDDDRISIAMNFICE
jgi:uncharacterized protein (TIGR02466 family)